MAQNNLYGTTELGIGQKIIVGLALPEILKSSQSGNISRDGRDDWRKCTPLEEGWYTGEGLNGYVELLGIDGSSIELRCGTPGLEESVYTLNAPNTTYRLDLSKIDPTVPQEEQAQIVVSLELGDILNGAVSVTYIKPTFREKTIRN
jgi:hypothetical protein